MNLDGRNVCMRACDIQIYSYVQVLISKQETAVHCHVTNRVSDNDTLSALQVV